MNIEIANKLLQLRKEKGYSQEALAQELGISRQAVSKWERAEASPDTDNLIELAKLYGISLDQLLLHEPTETEETISDKTEDMKESQEEYAYKYEDGDEYVHGGFDGIHVKDDESEVHVSWKGIHVIDRNGDGVNIGDKGVYVNGERKDWNDDWTDFKHNKKYDFPFGSILFIGYLIYGVMTGIWHPTWIVLLTLPLFDSLITAFRKRKFSNFAYPVLTLMIFLWFGFENGLWHPAWIVFLTVPCYYGIAHYIDYR